MSGNSTGQEGVAARRGSATDALGLDVRDEPLELKIERLSRLYAALRQVNHAIVRRRTRAELLQSVCEVLVEQGGFRLAWVGWHDAQTHELVPVARSGDEQGYVQSVAAYTDDRPEGCGPCGTAFREACPSVCNELSHEPTALRWRAEAERRGYRAQAVFPIRLQGEVQAVLCVYTEQPGFFRETEVALLGEAAVDLSFALDNLEHEAERQRADLVVKRLVAIVESTDDAIISETLAGNVASWNAGAERMFGYTAAEAIGRPSEVLLPNDRASEQQSILLRVSSGQRIKHFETERARKGGELFPVSIAFSPIRGSEPLAGGASEIVGASQIVRDISERKHTEDVADRERRFADNLLETTPGVLYLYDERGRFLRWNRSFERVSGYSPEEIARMHPRDFFFSNEQHLLEQRIAEVFDRGESSVEALFVSKNGRATPYFFTGRRMSFDGMTCLVGMGIDITDRKLVEEALRRSEERYRSTLDNILEGCQLLAFDWSYLYLNDAAAQHNRRPNAELLGKRMPDVWPGIEQSDVFALLRHCMEKRIPVHRETQFAFLDGTKGWFDVRAQPVPEGVFVLSIDISERKQAEVLLHQLNESLELKVAERTTELDAARKRAESADRLKSAFLATMSHELRTPLNSILGFTGIILQGLAGPLNAEQAKQLGMVQGSARHLLELINDVLDISKIEAGQLEVYCAPFDLRASVERVSASVKPFADKKGLSLSVDSSSTIPTSIDSDRRRVEQILLNLLNNAIKFTDRGGVTVTCETVHDFRLSGTDESRLATRIRVADTGMGIKQEDLAILFQPFRQLDAGIQRQHEGTGLGLAICGRLAALLSGTIAVESRWGEGSVFSVTLPIGAGT